MAGVPLRRVQLLTGHADYKTTEIYAHWHPKVPPMPSQNPGSDVKTAQQPYSCTGNNPQSLTAP